MLDWGIRSFRRGVNAVRIPAYKKFAELMEEFSPNAIVVQKGFFESKKKTGMRDALLKQAESHRIPIRFVTRRTVRLAFVGANRNKYTIRCRSHQTIT